MRTHIAVVLLLSGVMLGCASSYDYKPSVIAKNATLSVTQKLPFVYLFNDPTDFKKKMDQDAPTTIPVGRRLWVELGYSYADRAGRSQCVVTFSFMPEAGMHYELGYLNGRQRCYGTVMQRGSDGTLGKVPSVIYKTS
jgi:hypothetical protein